MHGLSIFSRRRVTAGVIAGATALCVIVVVMAQGTTDAPGAGSLAGVTAELRQLRLAVEESTRTQRQTHALGVYISAQQSRLLQVAGRLDVARRELDAVAIRSKQLAADVASNEDAAVHSTKSELRPQYEVQARYANSELDKLAPQLQLAQAREAELAQMLQAEEARWADLIARLEQLVKK
jgi:hypothetical protein